MINIIFAVDRQNNFCSSDRVSLPWGTIKEDMIHFKTITTSNKDEPIAKGSEPQRGDHNTS